MFQPSTKNVFEHLGVEIQPIKYIVFQWLKTNGMLTMVWAEQSYSSDFN